MNNLVEDLKKYFQSNTREKILEDWLESEEFDLVSGPAVKDFISESKIFFQLNQRSPQQVKTNFNTKPEVRFGFLICNN